MKEDHELINSAFRSSDCLVPGELNGFNRGMCRVLRMSDEDTYTDFTKITDADRLVDQLEGASRIQDKDAFIKILQEVIPMLAVMHKPSMSEIYNQIVYLSEESSHEWKRTRCNNALMRIQELRRNQQCSSFGVV